jgi:hypothetical protein
LARRVHDSLPIHLPQDLRDRILCEVLFDAVWRELHHVVEMAQR